MKTAISIPDKLFKLAEKTASRMGIPRSQLFARALEDYIQRNSNESITEKLNEIYSSENSSLDPAIIHIQKLAVSHEEDLESW
jgi:metal-responsive CopG/Arc/MetJ family transcriptional regulator